jgi:hypothetical protein
MWGTVAARVLLRDLPLELREANRCGLPGTHGTCRGVAAYRIISRHVELQARTRGEALKRKAHELHRMAHGRKYDEFPKIINDLKALEPRLCKRTKRE